MEPVTTSIVAALVAGAVAASQKVGTKAVEDTYAALRTLIADRYKRAGALASVEEDPTSEPAKATLADALEKTGAAADPEVGKAAADLAAAVEALPPAELTKLATLKVDLASIWAGRSILLERLSSTGDVSITVRDSEAKEDVVLRDVAAGKGATAPKS